MMLWPVPTNAPDIGECIYCGASESEGRLQTEHAIPYGLNGDYTLLRASCDECAIITSRFEREALRGLLPAIRNALGMRTRRRKERARTLAVVLESAGVQSTVEIPRTDFPLYLPTPVFPAPGVVVGRPPTPYTKSDLHFRHIAGPTFEEFAKQHPNAEFVGARVTYVPDEFARMLAKIGYCIGVYSLGIAPLRESPIRRVIRGEDPCVGHWVGSWTGEPVNPEKGIHAAQVKATINGDEVHVVMRLFAQFGAPEYHVVLGRVKPEHVNSAEWKFKPPSEPTAMPTDDCDIGISSEGSALSALADDFENEVSGIGLRAVAEHREDMSMMAGLEWLLPTAVVVWLTNKYVGTLLQEAAKDHYPKLQAAILRLVRRTTGRDRQVKLTVIASTPEKITDSDPVALSVWIPRQGSPNVIFRFDQDLSDDELGTAVEELFAVILAHAKSGVLSREPSAVPGSRSTPTVMRFNTVRGQWESWVFDDEGHATPSSARSKP
jgi:hypothetical protein